ncbi:hypothetical protein INT45_013734 [Circinella minor]|uniref:Uncharacterized protein n=1 Tax=Circinella minor TaxID=1195481 RepID=A0A8H7VR18_9FUNG|nr:hypothetical protein INT45_013734 [Circinella minor]
MVIETIRPPSYEHSIRESRSSFSTYSDSGSSDGEGLPHPPEKMIETNERISTRTLFDTSFLPVFNIIATLGLIAGIIIVYTKANGQPVDNHTQANLPIPVLISLLVSLVILFIGGGIGYAVSEYKWARFQSKAGKLALLDAYDACSRGVGGAIRAIPALRLDAVLIATIIFYLGTIVIGPVAQGILHTQKYEVCTNDDSTDNMLRKLEFIDTTLYEFDTSSKDPRSINGVKDYFNIQLGLRHFYAESPLFISATCPHTALNCTYLNIDIPYVNFDCKTTDFATQKIVDLTNNNVTTIQDYWHNVTNAAYALPPRLPAFFYSGSMYNRTYYDLNNLTFPIPLGTERPVLDADARRGVGDVSMVVLSKGETFENIYSTEYGKTEIMQVRECTFRPYLNKTDLYSVGGTFGFNIKSSDPVPMDYDNKIGNNVYLASSKRTDEEGTTLMLNIYALQISMIRAVVLDEEGVKEQFLNMTLDQALHNMSNRMSLTYTLESPKSYNLPGPRVLCTETEMLYSLNPSAYLPLALCLLIPLIWWTVTWIISLYKVNGISRGHSQVALLVSGLSPSARDKMCGTIHENQYATMKAATTVDVKFGERRSDGHPTFGLPQEVEPVGVRRMSF